MKNLLMCAGPTEMDKRVSKLMASPMTNSTLDLDFFETYKKTCSLAQQLCKTENDTFIYNGEGLLGLEAAIATLTEKGDKVLCLDNGIYGEGFGDFCKMYGAKVTYLKSDPKNAFDVQLLADHLKKNHNYKYATLVHCETPSGITNPIEIIGPVLNDYGILSIVDAVSSTGAEEVLTDEWKIDVLLVGSQKCLSAAPGLTIAALSQKVYDMVDKRKSPLPSHYLNLVGFKDYHKNRAFPYTQPVQQIVSLKKALEIALSHDFVKHHSEIADYTRAKVAKMGLELYPESGWSNSVTAIKVPENIKFEDIFNMMLYKHKIMISGSFGDMKGKVFRIGHMGHIANKKMINRTFKALEKTLKHLS